MVQRQVCGRENSDEGEQETHRAKVPNQSCESVITHGQSAMKAAPIPQVWGRARRPVSQGTRCGKTADRQPWIVSPRSNMAMNCAILRARVSAFFYRYRRDVLGMDEAQAKAAMETVWTPTGVWAAFIGDDPGET